MKKFIAVLMIAFAFLVTTNVVGAQAANASVSVHTQTAVQASVPQSAPSFVAPGKAITTPFNLAGNSGGVKPAWYYTSCYWAMNGARYCWRYGCSAYERIVLGCYDGWYRTTIWVA